MEKIIFTFEDTNEEVSKILEVICYLFINYVLSIRDFIMKINLDECEKFIKNDYKFDDKNIQNKILRYQKIAENAASQSGRGIIPKIHGPITYDKALLFLKNMDI